MIKNIKLQLEKAQEFSNSAKQDRIKYYEKQIKEYQELLNNL